MQRWIVFGLSAVLLLSGVVTGGWFAYRSYKNSRPSPIWVPIPVNPALPMAKCDEIVAELNTKLKEPERLAKIVSNNELVAIWKLPTEDACTTELSKRIFVRMGNMNTPKGKVPAIHVGVKGMRKEREISGKIAMNLTDEALILLGAKPPN
jgi:hypothetical protein